MILNELKVGDPFYIITREANSFSVDEIRKVIFKGYLNNPKPDLITLLYDSSSNYQVFGKKTYDAVTITIYIELGMPYNLRTPMEVLDKFLIKNEDGKISSFENVYLNKKDVEKLAKDNCSNFEERIKILNKKIKKLEVI